MQFQKNFLLNYEMRKCCMFVIEACEKYTMYKMLFVNSMYEVNRRKPLKLKV